MLQVTGVQDPVASSNVPVDGVPDATVEAWFQLADMDQDGRVADAEARDFFLKTGLSAPDLSKVGGRLEVCCWPDWKFAAGTGSSHRSHQNGPPYTQCSTSLSGHVQIWKLVKSPEVVAREGKGLTRQRFRQVLRLVALAQSGLAFTEDNAKAALDPPSWWALHFAPLPPPRLGDLMAGDVITAVPAATTSGAPASPFSNAARLCERVAFEDDLLGLLGTSEAVPTAAAAEPEPAGAATFASTIIDPGDDDLFGLAALVDRQSSASRATIASSTPLPSTRTLMRSMRDGPPSRGLLAPPPQQPQQPSLEPPLAFEARLPPLQPKVSARLTMLAAGNGSLFAGPANNGGVLQWAQPEGYLQQPLDLAPVGGRQVCPSARCAWLAVCRVPSAFLLQRLACASRCRC